MGDDMDSGSKEIQYILYIQKTMPSSIKEGSDLYEPWSNGINQSLEVIEAAFNLQHIIEFVEFTKISPDERPEYIKGVPMMVKIHTSELFTGISDILEEFSKVYDELGIENTESVEPKGSFTDSSLNDPNWSQAVQDDDPENTFMEYESYGFQPTSSMHILQGGDKISKADDDSFANKRVNFLKSRLEKRGMTLNTNTRNLNVKENQNNKQKGKKISKGNDIREHQRHQTPSPPSRSPPSVLSSARQQQPQHTDINVKSKYDVPLEKHPLFREPINLHKWAQFTAEEREEVRRVVNRLRSENYPIPNQLMKILEDDENNTHRQYRVMMNTTTNPRDMPQQHEHEHHYEHVDHDDDDDVEDNQEDRMDIEPDQPADSTVSSKSMMRHHPQHRHSLKKSPFSNVKMPQNNFQQQTNRGQQSITKKYHKLSTHPDFNQQQTNTTASQKLSRVG